LLPFLIMPNLYKSYCYSSLDEVAQAVKSQVFTGDGSIIVDAVVNASSVDITTQLLTNFTVYSITPPACTKLGFDSSYTGITTADAVYYGSAVSLVLIIAWGIKIIRRAL